MPSSLNSGGEFPPGWRTCRVCGKGLDDLASGGFRFCPAHFAEYEARLQRGVTTADELDPAWFDTLATWRDRPAAVQHEADADDLPFEGREEGWLFFRRNYQGRPPDWLAIHQRTGVVVHFVAVWLAGVYAALLGHQPAPHQEHTEQRRGEPQSYRPAPKDAGRDGLDGGLKRLAQDLPMALYGVVDHPFGLHLSRVDSGRAHGQPSHAALTFTGWAVDQPYYARLKLETWSRSYLLRWERHWARKGLSGHELPSRPFTLSTQHVAEQTLVIAGQEQQVTFYQLPNAPDPLTLQAAHERLLRGDFGDLTPTELRHLGEQLVRYEQPEVLRARRSDVPEYQFTWQEAGEPFVLGESANLTLTELTHLLEQVVRVNDRPDLLLHYEAELH